MHCFIFIVYKLLVLLSAEIEDVCSYIVVSPACVRVCVCVCAEVKLQIYG